MNRPTLALARLLRCTEGRIYTTVIVTILALLLLLTGVPPLLEGPPAGPGPAESRGKAVPTTTTIAIPRFGDAPPSP